MWNQHGSDEILWTVSGVGKTVEDSKVLDRLMVNVVVVVGAAEVVDWWVEDQLSRYVVVGGIPKVNWTASGWVGVRRDNPTVAWGHRGPLVVGRVWKNNVLTVKLEVRDAAAVGAVVKSGVVVGLGSLAHSSPLLLVVGGCRGVPPLLRGAPLSVGPWLVG